MAKYRKLPVIIEAEKVNDLLYGFAHDFNKLPQWVIDLDEKSGVLGNEGYVYAEGEIN